MTTDSPGNQTPEGGEPSGGVSVGRSQLWQATLAELQKTVSASSFRNYFQDTKLIAMDDEAATIAAPSPITANTLQQRFRPQIERTIESILGRRLATDFVVGKRADGVEITPRRPLNRGRSVGPRDQVPDPPSGPEAEPLQPSSTLPALSRDARHATRSDRGNGGSHLANRQLALESSASGLNPRLTFETYVVGPSNQFAHAASLAVAERPGLQENNPFFVHGGVGLGKTHLMHAIGHRALELQPNLTITYVTSETFTNDVIVSIRNQQMEQFRERYRSIDILMIDDIQFIAGKESTQEEFFHTFNALYQSGKQIILSSDKPPKAIARLEERMRSRFAGGLVADVQSPNYEMRMAIIRSKADERGIRIGDDIIQYIASKDQTNIRELEGALNKILMMAQIANRPLSLQLAMEALSDIATANRTGAIRSDDVIGAVLAHYRVSEKDLFGRQRKREIVLPRQVAMYLLREETDSSLSEIGAILGRRDHTTVIHGIEKIEALLETDVNLRGQLMSIRESLLTSRR
ncbi:MAG: chromosomal replication initiator protein DnaA [Thermomicrobiales bacterium]